MPKHKSDARKHTTKAHKHVAKAKKAIKAAQKPVMKLPKSPVLAALQKAGVQFEVLHHGKDAYTCEDAARLRNRPIDTLVKCLVLTDGISNVIACVPGDKRINTSKVREIFGTGKLEFAHEEDLKKLTGMQAGAISPIGLKSDMPVVIDRQLAGAGKVNMSGGDPSFGVEIRSMDLVELSKAKVAEISK